METKTTKWKRNNMILAFLTLVAAIVLVALVGFFVIKPGKEIQQGQAETNETRISSKVPGRIVELRVQEGEWVNAGDTLALLDSPEVRAKLLQAQSAQEAARAQSSKAIRGTREETIQGAYATWQKAQAGLEIAQTSYERLQRLFDQGVVPEQKRDEAEANYKSMKATEAAARSQYEMAVNGAQQEDKMAASALVSQAQGAIDEVESYLRETILIAPISGQVSEIFPQPGELVGTGAPIMNIMDRKDMWVVFNLREDKLQGMQPGTSFKAYIPALDKEAGFTTFYMKDMGSYAAWKATKTVGQYDLKTFEVKARPDEEIEGLYPGMSVIIP
ncbi:efflux RND transporter periplasmic adaptor subunit [Bacteroidales bacterium OttesenSCG-928-J19]|nr:efflux RND transporter periplasmic adaptor subunit [Bacteroidales bacterium OttesenSCG-928-J19]